MSKLTNAQIKQQVTDTIIEALEKGCNPWQKPWSSLSGGSALPHNVSTSRDYSGINVPYLWAQQMIKGYKSNQWLTYKQALELGGNVKYKEEGSYIVFASPFTKKVKDKETGKTEELNLFTYRLYSVFNVEQCENLELPVNELPVERPKLSNEKHAKLALDVANRLNATVNITDMSRAFYSPSQDFVHMPTMESFKSGESFAATLFHELTHWTGHESRCNRDGITRGGKFGDPIYAFEELVAEMGSAMVCARYEVPSELENHASYLEAWLKALRGKDGKELLFKASKLAQEALNYITNTNNKQVKAA